MKNKDLDARVLTSKYLRGEQLFEYERRYLWRALVDKADKLFSKFIRRRDSRKDCVTGDVDTCQHKIMNACHWIDRGWYSHRWREDNVFGGCVSCNKYHAQQHGSSLERKMTKEKGIDWVDEQYRLRSKKKPTIDELLEIISKYK